MTMTSTFQRSRFCGTFQGECVEASLVGEGPERRVLVRDSNQAGGDITLRFTPDEWTQIYTESRQGGPTAFRTINAKQAGITKQENGHPAATLLTMTDGERTLFFTLSEVDQFIEEAKEDDSRWELPNLKPTGEGMGHEGHAHS